MTQRFWWVNHKQTFRQEIDGGYLWSPKTEKNGARSQFYENMRIASPGDVVFSYANAAISFWGFVEDYAAVCPRPSEFGQVGLAWAELGWLLPVEWHPVKRPIRPRDHLSSLTPLLPKKYSPISLKSGHGNQKAYLAEISYLAWAHLKQIGGVEETAYFSMGQDLPGRLDEMVEMSIRESKALSLSEKTLLIKARIGQGEFRKSVFQIEKCCRLTGVSNPNLLIASHIKPWRLCETTNERLDGNNGLLLTPHVDLLFDRGLISFSDDGKVIISSRLERYDLERLGLEQHIDRANESFSAEQCAYLDYHRKNVLV